MTSIFFSYSHKDMELRDRLETQLAILKRQGVIDVWYDRKLVAGDEFAGRIADELERADIILLLVSPDFLESEYCCDIELKRAMERHEAGEARVIPVILRHCDWRNESFGKLSATPRDGRPVKSWPDLDEAFMDVVMAIRAALPSTPPHRQAKSFQEPLIVSAATQITLPRSSNLAIRKSFSEADRDRHLSEAFDYMSKFFEGSLAELEARNDEIETSFQRVDATKFTAVIYKKGSAVGRCCIAMGGALGRGITYGSGGQMMGSGFSEHLSVECDGQGMFLKSLGMAHPGGNREPHLTFEGAAELFWEMLRRPLD